MPLASLGLGLPICKKGILMSLRLTVDFTWLCMYVFVFIRPCKHYSLSYNECWPNDRTSLEEQRHSLPKVIQRSLAGSEDTILPASGQLLMRLNAFCQFFELKMMVHILISSS